jgi:hypothetical protein
MHWDVLDDVARRSRRYLEDIGERRVPPTADALAGVAAFDVPLQEGSLSAEQVVEDSTASARRPRWRSPAGASSASSTARRCRPPWP